MGEATYRGERAASRRPCRRSRPRRRQAAGRRAAPDLGRAPRAQTSPPSREQVVDRLIGRAQRKERSTGIRRRPCAVPCCRPALRLPSPCLADLPGRAAPTRRASVRPHVGRSILRRAQRRCELTVPHSTAASCTRASSRPKGPSPVAQADSSASGWHRGDSVLLSVLEGHSESASACAAPERPWPAQRGSTLPRRASEMLSTVA